MRSERLREKVRRYSPLLLSSTPKTSVPLSASSVLTYNPDSWDSESFLYPSHRSRSARCAASINVSAVVDGYEVRVGGRLKQSPYNNAPASGLIHWEI